MIGIYIGYFDEPLGWGVALPARKQVDITLDGLRTVLDTLQGMGVRATCYISLQMASEFAAIVERLHKEGHRVVVTDNKPRINYWRSLHILPPTVVAWQSSRVPIEFNAWEFSQKVAYNKELRLPFAIRRNAGNRLAQRLAVTIDKLKNKNNGI